jgi:hypothetical protein
MEKGTTYAILNPTGQIGEITLPLYEARIFYYHLNRLYEYPLKMEPDPRFVQPEKEGWTSITESLPPLETEVRVFGLSEGNEVAYLSYAFEMRHPSLLFEGPDKKKYMWGSVKGSARLWNPVYITHWKSL